VGCLLPGAGGAVARGGPAAGTAGRIEPAGPEPTPMARQSAWADGAATAAAAAATDCDGRVAIATAGGAVVSSSPDAELRGRVRELEQALAYARAIVEAERKRARAAEESRDRARRWPALRPGDSWRPRTASPGGRSLKIE